MQKVYRTGYPSDVNDEEWTFLAPYLALCREDAEQREHYLKAVFNGLRYIVKTGNQWRMMPHDLPLRPSCSWHNHPWEACSPTIECGQEPFTDSTSPVGCPIGMRAA